MKVGEVKSTYYEKSIFIITFFSTFMLVQFWIFDLFWILQILFFLLNFISTRKLRITKDKMIISLYVVWILSTIFCLMSDIPVSYKKNSIIAIAFLVPTFLSVSFYERYLKSERFVGFIRKALTLTCVIEVILCLVQFVLYKGAHIDLNQLIFRDILHMVENPSQYKVGVYHPSGMCWHSVFIAPVAILTFVLSQNYIIKILAIMAAVVCNNATAMIGISVCILFYLFFCGVDFMKKTNKCIRKRIILSITIVLLLAIPILIYTGILSTIIQKIIDIYERSTGIVYDGGSANAHIRYYTAYPQVVDNENIIQIFFGYGTGNSGYPISKLFGQYAELKSWVVESDVMNQLYSNGIIGFIFYYGFLLYIAIRGYRLDRRYFILIISFIIAGITYNIQFDWLIFLEILLYICVKKKINLFEKRRIN